MSHFLEFDYFIFDFDGTLFNSPPVFAEITTDILAKYGVENFDKNNYISEIAGLSLLEYTEWIISKFQIKDLTSAELLSMFAEEYEELLFDVPFVDGAMEFLQLLKRNGKKIGIASAGRLIDIKKILEHHSLINTTIDCVITCDMVKSHKPEPDVFLACLRELGGTIEKAVIFEDSIEGLKGARDSGIYVVGMITESIHIEEKTSLCDEHYCNYNDFLK